MRLRRWIRFLIGCFILGIFVVFIFNFFKFLTGGFSTVLISPILNLENLKQNSSLEKGINKALEGSTGTYSIAVKNLKTGKSYYLDEHRVFEAASLYKLWVMGEVFNQIKKGDLKEEDVLSKTIPYLNNKFGISQEDAELKEGGITLSVKNALNQMITISHNYAAMLLTEKVKLSSVEKYLKDNGFKESKVGTDGDSPKTTAFDILLFFEKLYNGRLIEGEYTKQMLELLSKQQLNNKLPQKLPAETVIAHKTGEIYSFSHDGGIVLTSKGDYIIVVLADTAIPKAADDRIADISLAVYKYFTR
ncbi:hypothetical protein A3C59_02385 [Candidatus Daviesbacteria bacterium RIFCSPHIGHO2_02_FULL_36_13]|uniref:Beta-lactamase class A catalytic domain-containing protein n=1 Tax=Candidatus Daviesbacteria bacterium RIFCSPHIGHO2_02_FULL_36_13 TaxID=1797768 RepID=A0A1F5JS68_9BACT|nr:MAG: hypothetical protein A3C59_02385 [Candidatus Daviesbacteria bacterium RIFCSPHIGHO2_02_FULL_36_13]OGE43148.1 MAG: hypothetical protein A3A45_00025 [Candidatus Daviesbacteria bacterium RIFCSPLOWO2_01_FULL_36_8]